MVCKKGPNKAHRFKNHICEYCGGDDLDFERGIVEKVLKLVIKGGHLTTGVLSGMRREIAEYRPIDKKLAKLVNNISHMDELIKFADEIDTMITDHYCDGCDRVQDCDNCDDRKGDPPPYDDMG